MTHIRSLSSSAILIALCLTFIGAAKPKPTPTPAPSDLSLHDRIVAEYLDGKWDELETDLAANTRELAKLSGVGKTDIAYIRQSLAECRPSWWKQCKSKNEFEFKPALFGRTILATFDPNAKTSVNIKFQGPVLDLTVHWDTADMDNPEHAEHGFSKGELCNLGAWSTLGMAATWAATPTDAQLNLSEDQKIQFTRFLDFYGNVTGAHYATPRARRWGLWLYQAAYMEKYAKMPIVMSRRAVAAMFVAELASHRDKYPSFQFPSPLPTESIEEKLALHFKNWIEKHPWTVAEDKSIREAIKSLAIANDLSVLKTGRIKLPNNLFVSLDLKRDESERMHRDLWLKKQLDKPVKSVSATP